MGEFEYNKYKAKLGDIKSSYIITLIFSFLSEKKILNMIMYNKELQNLLLFDIDNYKENSHKYKIGERNGKGKEYKININILIFEGEYLNGERNGKGKEYYDNGNLLFEGEYLNGKRWNGKGYKKNSNKELEIENGNGKGKDYYYSGKLKFVGEYLNGERNGKGKEYYNECKSMFEGEYLNGERNGKGKEYYNDGALMFEGEYLNGKDGMEMDIIKMVIRNMN